MDGPAARAGAGRFHTHSPLAADEYAGSSSADEYATTSIGKTTQGHTGTDCDHEPDRNSWRAATGRWTDRQ